MTSPEDSVFPITDDAGEIISGEFGLTKREYFAALAMQSLLASNFLTKEILWTPSSVADRSVEYADALIAALNSES